MCRCDILLSTRHFIDDALFYQKSSFHPVSVRQSIIGEMFQWIHWVISKHPAIHTWSPRHYQPLTESHSLDFGGKTWLVRWDSTSKLMSLTKIYFIISGRQDITTSPWPHFDEKKFHQKFLSCASWQDTIVLSPKCNLHSHVGHHDKLLSGRPYVDSLCFTDRIYPF